MPIDLSVREVSESPETWRVEYFDYARRNYSVTFAGPNAYRRAQEYADAIRTDGAAVTAFPG